MKNTSPYGEWSARVYSILIDPLLRALRRRITAVCVEQGLTDVIDIACATGAQCRSLHRAGLEPTGLDLSEAMISRARRIGPARIRYVVGSAFSLPFPTGAFSGAILSLCLHEHPFTEQDKMLAEAMRVVRPGGRLIIAEYSPPERGNPTWAFIQGVERLAGKEHFRNFRGFVRVGGADRFIARLPKTVRQERIFSGTIALIVAKKL